MEDHQRRHRAARLSAADRRAAILDDALEVFSERGFNEASLDDVAARGGISKALIYEHFTSKRELQIALLDTFVHELIERVVGAIASPTRTRPASARGSRRSSSSPRSVRPPCGS